VTASADLYEFDYHGTTYPLDLSHLPASEGIWLEAETKKSLTFLLASFATGGMWGSLAMLLLALRRGGQHKLAKWERMLTIDLASDEEFVLRRIPTGDEAEEEGGQDADPTSPSRSTPTDSATEDQTADPSTGSAKKSPRTPRSSSTGSSSRPGTSATK
jgi:hypothetical protein